MAAVRIVPLTLAQANYMVANLHRHHKPTVGHRFSIGVVNDGILVGACIVGRPVAPKTNQSNVAEVTRLVTDGTKNACSLLYGAAARSAKAMGYHKIQTFILETECGASLKAAGWVLEGHSFGGDGWQNRAGRRSDQPTCAKSRWVSKFSANSDEEFALPFSECAVSAEADLFA